MSALAILLRNQLLWSAYPAGLRNLRTIFYGVLGGLVTILGNKKPGG